MSLGSRDGAAVIVLEVVLDRSPAIHMRSTLENVGALTMEG